MSRAGQLDVGESRAGFRMESFGSRAGEWHAMDEGPAKSVWRPRKSAAEAAGKCLAWTGRVGIPAMQVRNLATGEVVWRFGSETYEAEAGPRIELPEAEEALAWRLADEKLREASAEFRAGAEEAPAPNECGRTEQLGMAL